ncbi:unnamed protein product [Calypogeia fissa]
MVRDSFSSLKAYIAELGLLIPRSDSREEDDQAQKEPPMEPDSPIVNSQALSPIPVQPSPSSGAGPSSPRAPTIEELAQQSIPDREPPSCPFVTNASFSPLANFQSIWTLNLVLIK